MRRVITPAIVLLATVVSSSSVLTGAELGGPKHLIHYGWGNPETRDVRDGWEDMERLPFHGTGVVVTVDRTKRESQTSNHLAWQVMGRREFTREEFRDTVRDLRVPRWKRFHHNFLDIALSAKQSAGGLEWHDDARWRVIVKNFAVVGWIAQEAGLRGLILDPEHYGYALFSYPEQRRRTGRSFDELRAAARVRGRQVMAAINSSMREPVLLALFGYTLPLSERRYGKTLETGAYGLLPAFLDGILEEMPDTVTLVDGYEFAYGFKERAEFAAGYRRVHDEAIALSAVPEHYRRKVRAGFGIRLDNRDRLDYFTPQELRNSLEYALEISDGYVWLYSQEASFFPVTNVSRERLEAIADAAKATSR